MTAVCRHSEFLWRPRASVDLSLDAASAARARAAANKSPLESRSPCAQFQTASCGPAQTGADAASATPRLNRNCRKVQADDQSIAPTRRHLHRKA